jgi:hypothetical protein
MRDSALRTASRRRRHLLVALAGLALAVAIPSSGLAAANIPEVSGDRAGDFDARTGRTAPTAAQKALVRKLGATATWNRFGTPQTLMGRKGYLSSSVEGRTAIGAARAWMSANRALFRLRSTDGLRVGSTTRLGKLGRAVTLRQRVGGVTVLPEGLVTIALRKGASSWRIVSVSSSLVGQAALGGSARLSARSTSSTHATAGSSPGTTSSTTSPTTRAGRPSRPIRGSAATGIRGTTRARPSASSGAGTRARRATAR